MNQFRSFVILTGIVVIWFVGLVFLLCGVWNWRLNCVVAGVCFSMWSDVVQYYHKKDLQESIEKLKGREDDSIH